MTKNQIKITKTKNFDGFEIKNAIFENLHFPKHFHLDWSLVFIKQGSENIQFNGLNFTIYQNCFLLIPPYSIHSNGNIENWSYTAGYINNDVIKFVCKKFCLNYDLIITQPYFINYHSFFNELNEKNMLDVLSELLLNNQSEEYKTTSKKYLSEIVNYITNNSNEKITLDFLEKKFKINKFKLCRLFNSEIGISPIEYQNSIRIEKSKSLFYQTNTISEIALEVGYFDHSHFTHNFKKYIGITPKQYKNNCKILQVLE